MNAACWQIISGGYFGIIMNQGYLNDKLPYFDNLESRMKELEEAGVWKIAEREVIDEYMRMHGNEWKGVRFVLKLDDNKNDALGKLKAASD